MKSMMLTVAVVAFANVACGGAATPVPADKLARAQEALRQAEEMPETALEPKALMHLELAKNQLQYAKKLMVEGNNEEARWVLMRAESDAEASLYLAHEHGAKTDAEQTIDAIRKAMTLMQHGGSGT